jgi:hypothetical protein
MTPMIKKATALSHDNALPYTPGTPWRPRPYDYKEWRALWKPITADHTRIWGS